MITPSFGLTATERVLPKLALDFTTASLDSRVTFTRTTGASNPATYVNSSGYIAAATNNQPRFDYDPITLACKGLLIEESRANLCVYSQSGGDGNWAVLNGAKTSTNNADPFGTNTAILYTANGASGSHYLAWSTVVNVSYTSGTSYTTSVFVKAGTLQRIQLTFPGSVAGAGQYANFLLTGAGSVTASSGGTAAIQAFSNGWYRISWAVSATASASGAGGVLYCISSDTDTRAPTNTLSGTIYAIGGQTEVGAFPTSYIPTTNAALTRNADVATMTGTNFSDWFNASEGTFTVQTVPMDANAAAYRRVLAMSDGTSNNRMLLYKYSSYGFEVDVGGATTANVVKGAAVAGSTFHVAAAYKTNSVNFANNAQLGTEDTSCAIPSGVNELSIGSNLGTSNYLNGWIGKIAYYNQRLTNSELQAFSK